MKFKESIFRSSIMLGIISIVFSIVGVLLFRSIFSEFREDLSKLCFVIYLSIYFSMWTLYFSSKNGPKIFRVTTLRRLLLVQSKSWTNIDSEDNDDIEELSMEKAKTSITAIAMLVGVSFLGLVQARAGLLSISSTELSLSASDYLWQQYIFISLGFISTIALVCFILSADALDCMFNEFKSDQLENKLRRYFYKSTIYPRYIGFVCLLTSIVFLNASSSSLFGSLSIAAIISIGYRHWFPYENLASESWVEKSGVSPFWLRFVSLMSIPVIISFL